MFLFSYACDILWLNSKLCHRQVLTFKPPYEIPLFHMFFFFFGWPSPHLESGSRRHWNQSVLWCPNVVSYAVIPFPEKSLQLLDFQLYFFRYLANYATQRCSILKTRLHFLQGILHFLNQCTHFVFFFLLKLSMLRIEIYTPWNKHKIVLWVLVYIDPKNRWIYVLQQQLALSLSWTFGMTMEKERERERPIVAYTRTLSGI